MKHVGYDDDQGLQSIKMSDPCGPPVAQALLPAAGVEQS